MTSSYVTPSSSPVPRLMAFSMLSAGIEAFLAAWTAERSRGFDSTLPPPTLAAIVISLISFVKRRPRFASAAPFLCLIVLHLLCPDMPHLGSSRPGRVAGVVRGPKYYQLPRPGPR